MLESEKRDYALYRPVVGEGVAKYMGVARIALYLTSDRRDKDDEGLCVYLKRTYRGESDRLDIEIGDMIRVKSLEMARVITAIPIDGKLILKLESVSVIDTGAYDLEDGDDV